MFSQGQITGQCIAENRINPYYQCGPNFAPVCGCDGITYRNECLSYNAFGNNSILNSGVCQSDLFFFDYWPTLVHNQITFYMQLSNLERAGATIRLVDVHGNTVLLKLLANIPYDFPYIETINLTDIDPGVYVMVVQVRGVYRFSKLLKYDF